MKKTVWNVILALSFFILWGNVISLLLPAEDYSAVIKITDFATILYLVIVLASVFYENRRKQKHSSDEKMNEEQRKKT